MVITRLQGGLGNQMFQYAFGRAFSLECGSELYVDTTFLKASPDSHQGFTSREYELNAFKTTIKIASPRLVSSFERDNIIKKGLRLFGRPFKKIYHEDNARVLEQRRSIIPPVLLIGYWQSEKYFAKYAKQIKEEFEFTNEHLVDIDTMAKIRDCNSVSVHIRRGDYVTNPVARDVLGVLNDDYYLKSFDIMSGKIDNPVYFFFSDDVGWVKQNLSHTRNRVIVESSVGKPAYTDMYMMSQCKHNIIANSSFSWWAAWLNGNRNKTIIAPALWNKNSLFNNPELIPCGWLKV